MRKNKNRRGWTRLLRKDFDWDYGFLLQIEHYKLKRMLRYFQESNITSDRESIVRDLKLCVSLLEKIMNSDFNYKTVNIKNIDRFINKELYEGRLEDWNPSFFSELNVKLSPIAKILREHLAEEKAWHLYHLIREYRMRYWWD